MSKIKIQVSKNDIEQAQSTGDFEQAPPGVYTASLESVTPGHAKGDDGQPDKSRPYLACVYQIDGSGRSGDKLPKGKNYSQLWDYVSFSEAAKWKMAQFALAMGLPVKNGAISTSVEIEEGKPGTIVGNRVVLSVKADKDLQGEYKAAIRGVYPLDDADDELFDDDDEGEDDLDIEDDDDEEDLEDDEDEEDEEDDESESEEYSEDDLVEMDLVDLSEIVEDLGGDADDLQVVTKAGKVSKVKTKKAMVAAILELQEEADEEDPF